MYIYKQNNLCRFTACHPNPLGKRSNLIEIKLNEHFCKTGGPGWQSHACDLLSSSSCSLSFQLNEEEVRRGWTLWSVRIAQHLTLSSCASVLGRRTRSIYKI